MANTSIDLGEHFTSFVANLKQSGRYSSVSEAVREGLRLLEKQEQAHQIKLQALRNTLIEGEESGESSLSHTDIIEQAKAELDG